MITTENKMGLSKRVNKLRNQVLETNPSVCTERAKIYTRVYKENEAKPIPIRRALSLAATLEEMTIRIYEDELIVGNHSSVLKAAPFFPEYATAWMLKELDSFDKRPSDAFYLTDEVKEDIKELCPFWDGRTTLDKGYALMPELYHQIHEAGIIRAEGNLTSGDAHIAVNNEKILSIGIKGYLEEVTNQRKALDLTDYSNLKKKNSFTNQWRLL